MSGAAEVPPDPAAMIAAWRAAGAQRVDPLRFGLLDALSRRAAAHQGEARRLLDSRLAQHLAAYGEAVAQARAAEVARPPPPPPRSALAELLDHIAQRSAADAPVAAAAGAAPGPVELKAVRDYRATWSRLSVEQRMLQSRAVVPDNAGPLNTQRLLHQALTVMRDVSPDYLQRLISQVEALLWLDQASLAGKQARKSPARGARDKGAVVPAGPPAPGRPRRRTALG